jgi:hypothetical protein
LTTFTNVTYIGDIRTKDIKTMDITENDNIKDSAEEHTVMVRQDTSKLKRDTVYDTQVFIRTDNYAHIVEFLLGGGGPTIKVVVDSRYDSATFHHTWGMFGEPGNEQKRDTWDMYGHDKAFWMQLATNRAIKHKVIKTGS